MFYKRDSNVNSFFLFIFSLQVHISSIPFVQGHQVMDYHADRDLSSEMACDFIMRLCPFSRCGCSYRQQRRKSAWTYFCYCRTVRLIGGLSHLRQANKIKVVLARITTTSHGLPINADLCYVVQTLVILLQEELVILGGAFNVMGNVNPAGILHPSHCLINSGAFAMLMQPT